VDYSREADAPVDDFGFFINEDGSPWSVSGDGAGGFSNPGPAGLEALVSGNAAQWSGELRIPAALLGGWGHVVGWR
jgi:hypothetical protein